VERLSISSRVEWPTTDEPASGADATRYSYEGTTGTCVPKFTAVPDACETAVRERNFGR
jgi:hypothetical protein